jgi:hypothetical protein
MDPISAAIIAALSAGAVSGLTDASKTTIADAFTQLKALLKQKFGHKSNVVQAVEQVEAKPTSAGRTATLQEEVTAVQADHDPDLLQAAQAIQKVLQSISAAGQQNQIATGNYIAQADRGSNASVNVGGQLEH